MDKDVVISRHMVIHAPEAPRSGRLFDIVLLTHSPTEREEGWEKTELKVLATGSDDCLRFERCELPMPLRPNEAPEPCVFTCHLENPPASLKEIGVRLIFLNENGRFCASLQRKIKVKDE